MGTLIVDDTFGSVPVGSDNMCVVVAEEGFHIALDGLKASEYPKGKYQFEVPKGSELIYYKGETDNAKISVYGNSDIFFLGCELGGGLEVKVIEIGSWNMDTDPNTSEYELGMSILKVRSVKAMIRRDDDLALYNLDSGGTFDSNGFMRLISSTKVELNRKTGGFFDGVSFDIMGGDGNRGWIIITYEN